MAWQDAWRLAGSAPALPPATVAVADAAGEVLAERLWARSPLPSFDCSAMDGYAVRGPGPWRVVGRVLAGGAGLAALGGGAGGGDLADGTGVEVATGAPVPGGCEGVVPYEAGVRVDDELTAPAPLGRHVRRRGEEVPALTALLPAGTLLSPAAAGLAAAVGTDRVLVAARPRVAVLVTGSELVLSGAPGGGRVRDALTPLLPPSLAAAGALVGAVSVLPDDADVLSAAVERACAAADLVVVSGSTAAGPADLLRPVLAGLDAVREVDGVACRPGHPMLLARLPTGTWVAGLPGNPLAALAATVTLVVPLVAALRGLPVPAPTPARTARPLTAHPRDTRLVPVRRRAGVALATGHDGPAMLRGAALADGFAVVGPGADVPAGADVDVLDLPGAG